MTPIYSQLITPEVLSVAESPLPNDYLSERYLQAMWLEQKYFKGLTTDRGEPIDVISPGIWNAEAGPDFQKAHLMIDGRIYRGDVELHLVDESWTQHQHHLDPRYDQTILHVSLWTPKQPQAIVSHCGKAIIRTYLEPCLTIPQRRIAQLIDLDLYPYKQFLGSGRCAHALFRTLPEKEVGKLFQSASLWRLEKKLSYLKVRLQDPQRQLAAGIAMALGYKNNAEAFLELFIWLQSLQQRDEELLLILGLHACGFFEPDYQQRWNDSSYYEHLLKRAQALQLPITHQTKLRLNKIRPLNHPIRRLAYLAKLLGDPILLDLYPQLLQLWATRWQNCTQKQEQKALLEHLHNLIPTYCDDYWNRHYIFEATPTTHPLFLPLIGSDLKNQILLNTFLPLLHADIQQRDKADEMDVFQQFYSTLPASGTAKSRYLTHRFFGDTPKGKLLKKAQIEQGAYQLHHDFCLHFEASCQGCPFVERYQTGSNHCS